MRTDTRLHRKRKAHMRSLDAVARRALARMDAPRPDRFAIDAALAHLVAACYGPHVCP